ncbi:MAG: DUF7948 domain-containing protein, partial [Thermoanaerobaculia bacterium]
MLRAVRLIASIVWIAATSGALWAGPPELVFSKRTLPLYFEPNVGQADPGVQFIVRGAGYAMSISDGELSAAVRTERVRGEHRPQAAVPVEVAVVSMRLAGASAGARTKGVDVLPGRSNYFIGNDPAKWRTGVPQYAGVRVENVYAGIDLLYRGGEGEFEYDFIVKPGADPRRIDLHFEGVDRLDVDETGDLVLHVGRRELRQRAPVAYQEIGGVKHILRGGYVQRFGCDVTFRIDQFDPTRPLVIDPALLYAKYLGGSDEDQGYGVAVDTAGNAFFVGATWSTDFVSHNGSEDAFVVKLAPNGTSLYATYLGGTGQYGADEAHAVAVDGDGDAYIVGQTDAQDFPVTIGAIQNATAGSIEAFIVKLNPTGSGLLYSTYAGGSVDDFAWAIAIDAQRAMYVTGRTTSNNFPTTPGGQPKASYGDAFVMKLSATGQLAFSTYLGGNDDDEAHGVALDFNGNIYVVGTTYSTNFPATANALQNTTAAGTSSAFLSEYDSGFTRIYSTYFHGASSSTGNAVTTDGFGFVYFAGSAGSTVPYCTCPQFEGSRGFVAKLVPPDPVVFAVAVGTPTGLPSDPGPQESATGIAVDAAGYVYVTGETDSDLLSVVNAVQKTRGGAFDAFVTKLRSDGTTKVYQTYLGGTNHEWHPKIALDASGAAYVTGTTHSSNFPNMSNTFKGSGDAWVAKIGTSGSLPPSPSFSATGQAANVKLTYGNVAGVATYVIERATAPGSWSFRALVVNSGNRTAYDMGVSAFTAYEYRISSVSDDGIGPPSPP